MKVKKTLTLAALFLSAVLAAGSGNAPAQAHGQEHGQPAFLTDDEWTACLERMNKAHMPAEEHCSMRTLSFDQLSPTQQSVLTKYHLFYNCAEPIWDANVAAGKARVQQLNRNRTELPATIGEMIKNGELTDAYSRCAKVTGNTFEEIRTDAFRTMNGMVDEATKKKGSALTFEEEAAIRMMFHRPFMPIQGFTQPAVPKAD